MSLSGYERERAADAIRKKLKSKSIIARCGVVLAQLIKR
jgi:hypothetical protein